jgi:hypothetical protein
MKFFRPKQNPIYFAKHRKISLYIYIHTSKQAWQVDIQDTPLEPVYIAAHKVMLTFEEYFISQFVPSDINKKLCRATIFNNEAAIRIMLIGDFQSSLHKQF